MSCRFCLLPLDSTIYEMAWEYTVLNCPVERVPVVVYAAHRDDIDTETAARLESALRRAASRVYGVSGFAVDKADETGHIHWYARPYDD